VKRELPTVPPDGPVEVAGEGPETREGAGPGLQSNGHGASAGKLIATLSIAGALAGLVIVLVFTWANPRILAYRAKVLRESVQEVLHQPARTQRFFVTDGALADTAPAGVDTLDAVRVFEGFDAGGSSVGFAITGAEPGFQDIVSVIFGYDPGSDRLLGMKVLESKETPGLGDRIMKDQEFISGFEGAEAPIQGVKKGAGTGDPHEVDMITGATISSRTVIRIINDRVEALEPVLDGATAPSGTRADAGSDGDGDGR
jgi:electron transport complex protein RnfG